MDKATILAAIEEANQEHSKNFKKLKKIGSKIANNVQDIKATNAEIERLKALRAEQYATKDGLKDELTILKVREGEILATKKAFEQMLENA